MKWCKKCSCEHRKSDHHLANKNNMASRTYCEFGTCLCLYYDGESQEGIIKPQYIKQFHTPKNTRDCKKIMTYCEAGK